MYLDAFTISALVDEFMDTLVGGRIQDSVDVDESSMGLEIYANHRRQYLYLSAGSQHPRVHVVPDKLRRGTPKPSQLGLLFRRYVEGGSIEHVSQPEWERILQFDIDGPEGAVSIIIEPMERRANLILAQNGIVLDCARRVGANENRFRVTLPAHPYVLPPPQIGKVDPSQVTLDDIEAMFAQNEDPKRKTHQVLTSRMLGMSPLLAREIVFRAGGDSEQKSAQANSEAIKHALDAVVRPLAKRSFTPGIVENARGVQAYSVYPIQHLEGWKAVESVSEAITRFYTAPVGEDAYNAGKQPVREALQEALTKLSAKLESLRRSLKDESEREILKQSGELILAYQYALAPGQTELRAQYDTDQPEMVVRIDPELSPLENAQKYFDKYNRAKRALDDVPDLIESTEADLAWLKQLETDLELAANWPEIDEVQQALQSRGYWRGKPVAKIAGGNKSAPLKLITKDNFVIWVGRNSRQNEIVTFERGSPMDTWLHARGGPGAHVIIKFDGRAIPDNVLDQAAALAAYYSANKNEARVIVDVTERRHVRKLKGGAVGMVTYRNEITRTVQPRSEHEFEK